MPQFRNSNGEQFLLVMSWVFDVNQAETIIEQTPREIVQVDALSIAKSVGLDRSSASDEHSRISVFHAIVDDNYAKHCNLDKPIIMMTLKGDNEKTLFPLDGNHRLRKAYTEGVTKLNAYVLSEEETLSIRSHVTAHRDTATRRLSERGPKK